jgi:hypothetical protein
MPRNPPRPPSGASAAAGSGLPAGAGALGALCALAETALRSIKAPASRGNLVIKMLRLTGGRSHTRWGAYVTNCKPEVSNGAVSAAGRCRPVRLNFPSHRRVASDSLAGKAARATLKNKLQLRYISNSLIVIGRWRYLRLSVILNAMESSDWLRPTRTLSASAGLAGACVTAATSYRVLAEAPIQCRH